MEGGAKNDLSGFAAHKAQFISFSVPSGHAMSISKLSPSSPRRSKASSLSVPNGDSLNSRGSMVLYRLADVPSSSAPSPTHAPNAPNGYRNLSGDDDGELLPPPRLRESVFSASSSARSSIISVDDSKYPTNAISRESKLIFKERGLVPYEYNPDESDSEDEYGSPPPIKTATRFPWRGFGNIGMLVTVILGLLMLFVFYPVLTFYRNNAYNLLIDENTNINSTGQASTPINSFAMPTLIDPATPDDAKSFTSFEDGSDYTLVFSDEFETDGRTFYPGDDPFWEAVDLWYGVTSDEEWYDPQQIITKDGALIITMDASSDSEAASVLGLTSTRNTTGSTVPFTSADNHGLYYRSGMLQSWNKLCFTGGYLEVAVSLPGASTMAQGYWPGVWTMGNLGRPGYPATTDGMWPYSYDSCDIGTLPNQTYLDGTGPPAELHSDWSKSKYDYELSWLPGQKLSACTCTTGDQDHPGPQVMNDTSGEMRYRGRGVPELDVLEAQLSKIGTARGVVSQSAQFAPFTRDYVYGNATDDLFKIYNSSATTANTYKGSAIQQAVSGLTVVPDDGFQGAGATFVKYGFEYSPGDDGYIIWEVDGAASVRMGASAMGPDPIDEMTLSDVISDDGTDTLLTGSGLGGSGVGQRLIPAEAMSIVLNLGISTSWQTIDLTSLTFPAEMRIDYVRVYQKSSETPNLSCSPTDYPTTDYINAHYDQYENPNLTAWQYTKPTNLLQGC